MKIPTDLVVISNNLLPSDLDEAELAELAYAKWLKVTDPRIGECIAVPLSEIKNLRVMASIQSIEDNGFQFKNISVEPIKDIDKKWNDVKGFFV